MEPGHAQIIDLMSAPSLSTGLSGFPELSCGFDTGVTNEVASDPIFPAAKNVAKPEIRPGINANNGISALLFAAKPPPMIPALTAVVTTVLARPTPIPTILAMS